MELTLISQTKDAKNRRHTKQTTPAVEFLKKDNAAAEKKASAIKHVSRLRRWQHKRALSRQKY